MRNNNRDGWHDEAPWEGAPAENQLQNDFAVLCAADVGEFTEALETLTQTVIHLTLSQALLNQDPLNELLIPCFRVQADSELYFHGDFSVARQAVCVAALLNHLGWNRISAEAQIWATQLLNCNIPSVLAGTGPMDIEKGRALMQHFVQNHFTFHLHPTNGRTGQQVIDPFIGM